jgi:hypothetical protein
MGGSCDVTTAGGVSAVRREGFLAIERAALGFFCHPKLRGIFDRNTRFGNDGRSAFHCLPGHGDIPLPAL